MAKSAKAVEKFLADLAAKLKPLVDKELKELSRYKSEEVCVGTSLHPVLSFYPPMISASSAT